jgi:hypothetical protein
LQSDAPEDLRVIADSTDCSVSDLQSLLQMRLIQQQHRAEVALQPLWVGERERLGV